MDDSVKGVLQEADGLINGPRNKAYGSFSEQAKDIADIYRILEKRRRLSGNRPWTMEEQYGWFMVITKLTREANAHKRDNFVDLCGYAELLHRLIEETDNGVRGEPRRTLSALLQQGASKKLLIKTGLRGGGAVVLQEARRAGGGKEGVRRRAGSV